MINRNDNIPSWQLQKLRHTLSSQEDLVALGQRWDPRGITGKCKENCVSGPKTTVSLGDGPNCVLVTQEEKEKEIEAQRNLSTFLNFQV